MQFFSNLKADPVNTLYEWQNTRWPWAIMAVAMAGLVLIAHGVFQNWLHMAPCEQCVYIRYGNLVMALGGCIALIDPKKIWTKLAAYIVSGYGLIYTFICSWKLMGIHDAVHSEDPSAMFGVQGCSAEPSFPFGLPLAEWAPDWFKPTGDCGYDSPMPAEGVELSSLQQYFVDLYQSSDGWYLVPQYKFMDMAECCFLACVVCAVILGAMLFSWLLSIKKRSILWKTLA
ncbi:protein-disulfide oxidoreductase DsbI [Turicimonas muris]